MRRRNAAWVACLLAVAGIGGCGTSTDSSNGSVRPSTRVLVLAASSLTDVFDAMEEAFETEYPDIDVETSFAGSNALAVQVEQGAPADVVAFADSAPMTGLVDDGLVDDPQILATNSVTIAVPSDNPGDVTSVDDFSRSGLLLGACAPEVPCGRYAADVFAAADVDPSLDTEEPDVRSLVAKIAAGELDAGIVYATDVRADPDELTAIDLPTGLDVRADYPIGVVTESERTDAARLFVDFTLSATGRALLADAGFGGP